jgi:hypothetical protein
MPTPELPKHFHRSGFLVKVKDVDPNGRNQIEGIVRPGGMKFYHQCLAGEFVHETLSGGGVIEVEGEVRSAAVGERVIIAAGRRFSYVNSSGANWHFRADHPFWRTSAFRYIVGNFEFSGDDVWFEIKRAPDATTRTPLYRLIPISEKMNSNIVAIEPNDQTFGVRSLNHGQAMIPVRGQGLVSLGLAQPSLLSAPLISVPGEVYRLSNQSGSTTFIEIRPDPPRVWQPHVCEWELEPGQFFSGDKVWFELAFAEYGTLGPRLRMRWAYTVSRAKTRLAKFRGLWGHRATDESPSTRTGQTGGS